MRSWNFHARSAWQDFFFWQNFSGFQRDRKQGWISDVFVVFGWKDALFAFPHRFEDLRDRVFVSGSVAVEDHVNANRQSLFPYQMKHSMRDELQ